MASVQTPSRRATILLWALSGLLAVAFLASGGGKITGAMTEQLHTALGVPTWAVPVIGVIEMLAAVALLVPKARTYAGAALVATMAGAVATHLIAADFAGFVAPLALGVLAGIVAWVTRPIWVRERFAAGIP